MARYITGTCNSPSELLSIIDAFLVNDLGWTRNMAPTQITNGRRAHYSKVIVKNGESTTVYWNFFANTTTTSVMYNGYVGLVAYGSTSFDGGLDWNAQPGVPIRGSLVRSFVIEMPLTFVSYEYQIHASLDGDVMVIFRNRLGPSSIKPQYLMCGVISKSGYGSYVGGALFGGSTNAFGNRTMFDGSSVYSPLTPGRMGYKQNQLAFLTYTTEVYLTLNGVACWFSIGNCRDLLSDWGTSNAVYASNLTNAGGSIEASTYCSPLLGEYAPGINIVSGRINSYPIEFRVYNSVTNRVHPIGTLPLVRYCLAAYVEGLPTGITVSQSDKQYILHEACLVELNE